ncbi:MAG: hypothetical protein R3C28_25680 [Pirellulaceae bacterium]
MHAGQLVELAASLASHSGAIVLGTQRISDAVLQHYWINSKCRLQKWQSRLHSFEAALRDSPECANRLWTDESPVIGEILASEILARVWTALLSALDQTRLINDTSPIAKSVFLGHLEARHRVLRLLLQGKQTQLIQPSVLNQFRMQSERWTDILLAMIQEFGDVSGLAFEQDRMLELADEMKWHRGRKTVEPYVSLVAASIQQSYSVQRSYCHDNLHLNHEISVAILNALGPELFHHSGEMCSLWQIRLLRGTEETSLLIHDTLLREFEPPSSPSQLPPSTRLNPGSNH